MVFKELLQRIMNLFVNICWYLQRRYCRLYHHLTFPFFRNLLKGKNHISVSFFFCFFCLVEKKKTSIFALMSAVCCMVIPNSAKVRFPSFLTCQLFKLNFKKKKEIVCIFSQCIATFNLLSLTVFLKFCQSDLTFCNLEESQFD